MKSAQEIASKVLHYFHQYGDEQYGEDITQQEHALQSALLAQQEGYEDEVIIAALLHDLGHLIIDNASGQMEDNLGMKNHEGIGAKYLKQRGFSDLVYQLIKGHVAAKRYLTFKYPDYYQELSEASKKTLVYQGGVMTADEAKLFEAQANFKLNLKMREWDDKGKVENTQLPEIDTFLPMIIKHLERALA
jgi:phosphonate degradation associated HDIG domain protein